ncbi:MAG: site-2 protease family protein [Solirubrobacterales bacterium]|nr:site-2 protease family protein [Solirubrobacterales bacterium]
MFGRSSIQLARVFGIRIGASPSWFFVLFVGIYLLTGYFDDVISGSNTQAFLLAVAAALLFFLSITLHELGHAIVARRNGVGTAGIDLIFFGGVAKLTRDADTPGAEFRIAAAGPLVTAVIVAACIVAGALLSHTSDVIDAATFNDTTVTPIYALLGFLATINLAILLFNLVPAFPLDGGRMARAAAWKVTGDRNRGTRFSGRAGQVFALAMIGLGIFWAMKGDQLNGIYTVVLGFFLFQAASGAVLSSTFSDKIGGITVADVMDNEPVTMPAETHALAAEDEFFLRYRWPWFAVTDDRGRYVGVLRRERAEESVQAGRPAATAGELIEEEPDRFRIGRDQPLEALLGRPGLRDLGALMAVDAEGVLCGVVTVEQIRRALTSAVT